MTSGMERRYVTSGRHTVPGGRHILGVRLDPDSLLTQETRTNDAAGRQWVWEPKIVSMGFTEFLEPPQEKTSAFGEVTSGLTFYNCNGYNTGDLDPLFGRYGIVILAGDPDPAEDLDLRLYLPSQGADHGFAFLNKASSLPHGETDFILIDLDAGTANYDIGILNDSGGVESGLLNVDVSGGGLRRHRASMVPIRSTAMRCKTCGDHTVSGHVGAQALGAGYEAGPGVRRHPSGNTINGESGSA